MPQPLTFEQPARLPDTRVWRFRVNAECDGGVEKRLFGHRSEIPADEDWFDSIVEAEAGVPISKAPLEVPFAEKTVAEQVAEMERAAAAAAPSIENAEDQELIKKPRRQRLGLKG